jgi:hypothetical protein
MGTSIERYIRNDKKNPNPTLNCAGIVRYEKRGIIKKKDVTRTKMSKKAGN